MAMPTTKCHAYDGCQHQLNGRRQLKGVRVSIVVEDKQMNSAQGQEQQEKHQHPEPKSSYPGVGAPEIHGEYRYWRTAKRATFPYSLQPGGDDCRPPAC
jgi:hypothetical protein